MAANQQTIEQRLAEFTEVHGTVLLGMHRELQSQLSSVDAKLSVAVQTLHGDADRMRDELNERARQVDDRYRDMTGQLDNAETILQQRDATLRTAMEAHATQMANIERRALEGAERTQRELSEQVDRTRNETGALIETATVAMQEGLQSVNELFKDSLATFRGQLEAAEAKVRTYMTKQQQLLDAEARDIQTLRESTQQLLTETSKKIDAHQRREAEFNRKLRLSLGVLAVATCVAVIIVISKPWIG